MFLSADNLSSKPRRGRLKIAARLFDLSLWVVSFCPDVKTITIVAMVD